MFNNKDLVSFVLIAYNQESYIRDAIEGAFSQTYSPLEIILSDDCSTDKTYEIMGEMARSYTGQHKVVVRRNASNYGLAGNYNAAVQAASGDIIVQAAGDDISLPERVMMTCSLFETDPEIYCLSTDMILSDNSGRPLRRCVVNKEDRDSSLQTFINHDLAELRWSIHNPSFAFYKSLFTLFGPLHERSAETYPIVFRAMLMGKRIAYIEETLVKYRVASDNISKILPGKYSRNSKIKLLKRKSKLADLYAHNIVQMRRDLVKAHAMQLIDSNVLSELTADLLKVERSQLNIRDFYENRSIGNFCRYLISERKFSLKEKLAMYLEGGVAFRIYTKCKVVARRS